MAMRWLIALTLGIALVLPVKAAKWEGGCPAVVYKPGKIGLGYSKQYPFKDLKYSQPKGPRPVGSAFLKRMNHVGHDVTVTLSQTDVDNPRLAGGFSTEPNGNSVVLVLNPVGRDKTDPIVLPPVPFTATSPTLATFKIPDSRPLVGELLVGPGTILVFRGETLLFEIGAPHKTVIMPPMNDMRALADQGYEASIMGAFVRPASVWFPLGFSGFGEDGESLPQCPTVLTPVTALALNLSLKKDEDEALPYVSMGQIKANQLFLGDYFLFGQNMYGNKIASLDLRPLQGNGVVLCALNDAIQLILKIPLQNPALGKGSVLIPLVRDGAPVKAKIENISADEYVASVLERVDKDAFSATCEHAP
jgi:hypothetical protein